MTQVYGSTGTNSLNIHLYDIMNCLMLSRKVSIHEICLKCQCLCLVWDTTPTSKDTILTCDLILHRWSGSLYWNTFVCLIIKGMHYAHMTWLEYNAYSLLIILLVKLIILLTYLKSTLFWISNLTIFVLVNQVALPELGQLWKWAQSSQSVIWPPQQLNIVLNHMLLHTIKIK